MGEAAVRFALIIPSWITNEYRAGLAKRAFETLVRTNVPLGWPLPLLLLLVKPSAFAYPYDALRKRFWLYPREQRHEGQWFAGCDQPVVYASEVAIEMGATHLVWLAEDTLYHPDWLLRLAELVQAKPGAVAWSAYRSAHTAVHTTLEEAGEFVRVRSINGTGLTVSADEFFKWGIRWQQGPTWRSEHGTTVDMHHLAARPGDRWVTRRSWIEHTGRVGAHARPGVPEWAIDFVGTGEENG
jgi:hypothetical protein